MLSISTIAEAIGNHFPKFKLEASINGTSILKSSLNATIILCETGEGIKITYNHKGFWGTVYQKLDVVGSDVQPVLAFVDECEEEVSSSMDSYVELTEGE